MHFPSDVWKHIMSFLDIKNCYLYKSLNGDGTEVGFFEEMRNSSLFVIARETSDINFYLYFYYFALSNISTFTQFSCRIKMNMIEKTIMNAYRISQESPSEYSNFIESQQTLLFKCKHHLDIIEGKNGREIINYFSKMNFPDFKLLIRLYEKTCYLSISEEFSTYEGKQIHSFIHFYSYNKNIMNLSKRYLRPEVVCIKKHVNEFNKLFHTDTRTMMVILTDDNFSPYENDSGAIFKRLVDLKHTYPYYENGIQKPVFVISGQVWGEIGERTRDTDIIDNFLCFEWFIRDCYTSGIYNKNYQ